MKYTIQITLLFLFLALAESFLPPIPVNPCTRIKCSTGTRCVVKGGIGFCQPVICSLPVKTGLCLAYFKRYYYNPMSQKCEEFIYGGCGGNDNNFVKKVDCKSKCDDPGKCPANQPQHYCLISPCEYAKCPAYPEAKCVENYCGGCKADFYVGSVKVDCACKAPKTIYSCKVAPCDVSTCPLFPKAKCVNNYCGGCLAEYYIYGRKVNCKKYTIPDPCRYSICGPGTKCVVINGKAECVFSLNP